LSVDPSKLTVVNVEVAFVPVIKGSEASGTWTTWVTHVRGLCIGDFSRENSLEKCAAN
jgi:hypothetical protein